MLYYSQHIQATLCVLLQHTEYMSKGYSEEVHYATLEICAFGSRFTAGTPLFLLTDRQDP